MSISTNYYVQYAGRLVAIGLPVGKKYMEIDKIENCKPKKSKKSD